MIMAQSPRPTQKTLVLLLFLTCTISRKQLLKADEFICTEETKSTRRQFCWNNCHNYKIFTAKTINCKNASAVSLALYKELKPFQEYSLELPPHLAPFYPILLNVTSSKIPVLPTNIFQNLKDTAVLMLENAELNTVMSGAFNSLNHLKEMYLGHNKLTTISDGMFNTLPSLEKLDLSNNKINTISNHSFVGTKLNYLNISNNIIIKLEGALINSFMDLYTLDLSHNNLSDVTSFRGIHVNNLNLSYNSIKSINFEGFHKISMLIDISFNHITSTTNFNLSTASILLLNHNNISEFEKTENTTILNMSNNNLKIVSSKLLSVTLLEFYASFNVISFISSDAFFGLKQLTHLYLDNNNLSSLPNSCFKDLSSLTQLNLSGNKLAYCKFGTFDNLIHLKVLDISNNNFKELPQYTLHSLSKLSHLFFYNNEISDININDLVEHLSQLQQIDLRSNPWSCQKLSLIVHKLKMLKVPFPDGNNWEDNNIHGIRCYETFENNNTDISNNNMWNSDINVTESNVKSLLYNYFNKDFKNTQFVKYLERLKDSINSSYSQNGNTANILNKVNPKDLYEEKKSEIFSYLIKDLENSNFLKDLENLRDQAVNASKLKAVEENKMEKISNSFKNLTEELENMLKAAKSNNDAKSLDNKYKVPALAKLSEDINESKKEKLIGPHEKIVDFPNYTGLLCVIAILLLLMLCVMVMTAFRLIFRVNKYSVPTKEEVELI